MSYIGNPIVSTDFPVDYKSGNGSTTAFTLSVAPASVNSIDVQISGVSQSPQTYSVSGTTLTFSAAPPTGTNNIVVRHLGVAGIPNTPSAASVVTSSIADANVTQAKLATGVASTGPAFRAYASSSQTVSNTVNSKIILNSESFDIGSCFNNTGSTVGGIPSYSFMPNVAGYYQINALIGGNASTSLSYNYIQIGKNGSTDSFAIYPAYGGTTSYGAVSNLIYLNGTTDYVDLYVQLSGTGTLTAFGGYTNTTFSGSLVRAA